MHPQHLTSAQAGTALSATSRAAAKGSHAAQRASRFAVVAAIAGGGGRAWRFAAAANCLRRSRAGRPCASEFRIKFRGSRSPPDGHFRERSPVDRTIMEHCLRSGRLCRVVVPSRRAPHHARTWRSWLYGRTMVVTVKARERFFKSIVAPADGRTYETREKLTATGRPRRRAWPRNRSPCQHRGPRRHACSLTLCFPQALTRACKLAANQGGTRARGAARVAACHRFQSWYAGGAACERASHSKLHRIQIMNSMFSGGTVGRGGAPGAQAAHTQPPVHTQPRSRQ
jgi:hypothetical protein